MNQQELLKQTESFLSRIEKLKKEDILPLREMIREHNRLYHELESPIISDYEYDQLFHALARIESDAHMFDEGSPTAKLAIMVSEQFQKVRHQYPMTSLDNTYNPDEVREWNARMYKAFNTNNKNTHTGMSINNSCYFVQPKYDGLGMAVIYEYGKFTQAITRGSGIEGEDVTLGAWEIANIPKEIRELSLEPRMEIRGEVMMSRETFERVNRERLEAGERLFANPRNAASGSLRQLDPLITRSRKLDFFAYAIPSIEKGNDKEKYGIYTYHGMMEMLEKWGFPRKDFTHKTIYGIDNLEAMLRDATKQFLENTDTKWLYTTSADSSADFDIDGMVIKLDDMTLWNTIGHTEHHPRYAIAYKFPAKQVRTKVISIEHSVGRTGTVTPVANLEAVEVTGVVVRRATLHNYDELAKKDVREGDTVFIMRAGEVIPEIVSVVTEVRSGNEVLVLPPILCPVCNTTLEQEEWKVAIFCPNQHCPAKIQGQFEMFVSKQGLNIDGLGQKQIELFLEKGWIRDFPSLFRLHEKRDDILSLHGYKEKSVNNLLASIEAARHTPLHRVLVALGIPNIGKKTARQLESVIFAYQSLHSLSLLDALFTLPEELLLQEKDIGPQTVIGFLEYRETYRDMIQTLFRELRVPEKRTESQNAVLGGKTFCVTGTFEGISREEIHALIESSGGEVRTSVSSGLDYLIAGEKAGSKKAKAEGLGVSII